MGTAKQVLVRGVVKEIREVSPGFAVVCLEDNEWRYDIWVKGPDRVKQVGSLEPGSPFLCEVYFKSKKRTLSKGEKAGQTVDYCQPYLFKLVEKK